MNYNLQKRISNRKGFTLVEIMVATSIFMVIMLIAMGALITSSDTSKKAQALRSTMDNVNFAMESMTRSLRMGSDYTCITSPSFMLPASPMPDCPLDGSGGEGVAIAFTPANHAQGARDTAYVVTERTDGTGTYVLQQCSDASPCTDLVSHDVNIEKLSFHVTGSSISDKIQPSVYILIKGVITIKGVPSVFAIQTMTSQRSSE